MPHRYLTAITDAERRQAEQDLHTWEQRMASAGIVRTWEGTERENKLWLIIHNTRRGYTCLGCRMGECAE